MKDGKEYQEGITPEVERLIQEHQLLNGINARLVEEIAQKANWQQLLWKGYKVLAIRCYHKQKDCSLSEATKVINSYLSSHSIK